MKLASVPVDRSFDGIVFLGGLDWWYHNRGHHSVQMAKHLGERTRVLYVNSIGVRVPSLREGARFVGRLGRKARSWLRGCVRIDERLAVLSPVSIPGARGIELSRSLLAWQIRRAASRLGIRRPLAWVECPPGVEVLERIGAIGLVYQRTDRHEEYPGADRARTREYDRRLKARADLTLYCSRYLLDEERSGCPSAHFLDHGVDYEVFARAGTAGQEPPEYERIPRPRVGFVGGIDAHTFDSRLFHATARSLADVAFVLVGACSIEPPWKGLSNVHALGKRPYAEVAAHMAACDVLIMPWNQNRWIEASNPVKLKEYLAVGRPIVSTRFPELSRYEGYVRVARSPEEFVREIRRALDEGADPTRLRKRVEGETWRARAADVVARLAERGLRLEEVPGEPAGRFSRGVKRYGVGR